MYFFGQQKSVRKKGPCPLKPGIQGFFITCDGGREHQATHEAIDVIDNVCFFFHPSFFEYIDSAEAN